jgi:hypothetical protein
MTPISNHMMRPGRWAGLIVMLAFVFTMAFLIKGHRDTANVPEYSMESEEFFSSVSPAEKWRDIEEWMLVMQVNPSSGEARPVGASHTAIRQLDEGTTSAMYSAEFGLQAKISPLLPTGIVKGSAFLGRDHSLTSFTVAASLGGVNLASHGAVVDDELLVKIIQPSSTSYVKKPLTQEVRLGSILRPSLARHLEIKTGEKMSSPVVDPLTGATRGKVTIEIGAQEEITLAGEKVRAFRVTTSVGDIETLMWVDADGKTLRRNLVQNLRMDRTDREAALKHAPQLEEPVAAVELNIAEFANVEASTGAAEQQSTLGVLGTILQ